MTPPLTDNREFEWTIDADNRFVSVNDNWLAFAEENDPYFADPRVVLGRSLWEFVTDIRTRRIYDLLIDRVRSLQHPVNVPFRCDSPDCRRFMEVTLTTDGDGGIRFVSRVLRLEPRPAVELLGASHLTSSRFLTLCSWCKRIRLPDDDFVEVEQAIERLDLFGEPVLPNLTHGCCPDCFDSLIGRFRLAR
jgi:hypothetical protein